MRKVLLMLSIVFLCSSIFFVYGKTSEQDGVQGQNSTSYAQGVKNQSGNEDSKKQSETEKAENKISDLQESLKNFKIIFFFVFGLLIVIIVFDIYLRVKKGKLREYIIKQVLGSERIAEKFTAITKSVNLTEKDINTIANRVLERKLLNDKQIQEQPKPIDKESFEPSKSTTKYLKGKSGKIFSRVEYTPENSFFKLINENDNTALFEFCGDEAEAIAKRIFSDDICNIAGNYQNAISVKTKKPGKIKRVGDQWEVTVPVEIKLI